MLLPSTHRWKSPDSNTPSTAPTVWNDLQLLSETFITKGKKETINQLNKIVKANKLTRVETAMLVGKLKTLLINNGYDIDNPDRGNHSLELKAAQEEAFTLYEKELT